MNPDHLSGGIRGAAIVLLVSAASIILLGIFAAEQMVSLMGWPPWPSLSDFVFRYNAAVAAVFTISGLVLLFIAARTKTRWLMTALLGIALFGGSALVVVTTTSADTALWALIVMVEGAIFMGAGAYFHDRPTPRYDKRVGGPA